MGSAVTLTTLDKAGTASPASGAWTCIILPAGTMHVMLSIPLSSTAAAIVDGVGASYAQDASRNAGEGLHLPIGTSMTLDVPPSTDTRTIYVCGDGGTATIELLPSSVRLSR